MYSLELDYTEFEYLKSILRSMVICDFVDDEYIYKAKTILDKLLQIKD